jgi:hypothetical protein
MTTMVKTDKYGWKYYENLPTGFRLASLEDFHINGRKKVGMEYLIQRANQPHFEIHYVREETKAVILIPFIDFEMVFVRTN